MLNLHFLDGPRARPQWPFAALLTVSRSHLAPLARHQDDFSSVTHTHALAQSVKGHGKGLELAVVSLHRVKLTIAPL
jgi:hypothetical protein